ncbi:MAG: phosphatidate cytidylyltransferase, partial [Candidatus Aureabacteria bacterium]|nr:phosphatidate cytidylyltransferase [Candidatus Auribacterota bacterium]
MFRTRLLTALLLILILIGVVMISHEAPVLFFLVGNLFVFLGMREFVKMSDGIRGLGILGGMLVFSMGFVTSIGVRPGALVPRYGFPVDPEWLNAALFLAVLAVFIFQATRKDGSAAIARVSTTIAGIVYVGWFFSFIPKINYYRFDRYPDYDGRLYIFFLFLVVKVNDSAAYLIGSRYGTHRLIPRISPKKTVEGAVAGVFGAGAAAVIAK